MTTPPDVRTIAARALHLASCEETNCVAAPEKWHWNLADAVLAAVEPVIRQQERDGIRKDIAEKIELRRRAALATARDRESDTHQQIYSNGQTVAYMELAERLDRYFAERAAAIARSHSTPAQPSNEGDNHDAG